MAFWPTKKDLRHGNENHSPYPSNQLQWNGLLFLQRMGSAGLFYRLLTKESQTPSDRIAGQREGENTMTATIPEAKCVCDECIDEDLNEDMLMLERLKAHGCFCVLVDGCPVWGNA